MGMAEVTRAPGAHLVPWVVRAQVGLASVASAVAAAAALDSALPMATSSTVGALRGVAMAAGAAAAPAAVAAGLKSLFETVGLWQPLLHDGTVLDRAASKWAALGAVLVLGALVGFAVTDTAGRPEWSDWGNESVRVAPAGASRDVVGGVNPAWDGAASGWGSEAPAVEQSTAPSPGTGSDQAAQPSRSGLVQDGSSGGPTGSVPGGSDDGENNVTTGDQTVCDETGALVDGLLGGNLVGDVCDTVDEILPLPTADLTEPLAPITDPVEEILQPILPGLTVPTVTVPTLPHLGL